MNSPQSIANGMLSLFNPKKQSGVELFMVSAYKGFASIPGDLYALTKDFLDSDHRWDNETDRIRLITLLKKGATSEDLKKIIKIVVEQYVKNLSENQCKRLLIKIGAGKVGELTFKLFFVNEIVSIFFSRVIPKFLFTTGMTGIISIGASVSRSIYTARDLQRENPAMYTMLRANGDYDLLYFIVKDYVEPYLIAITLQENNSPLADDVFEYFIDGVRNA